MLPENYLLFLQIIIVMFVTPGGPRVLIMSQSINYGFGKSLWTAFGDVTANCIQMLLVLFGLGALLKIFPDIVIVFKWVGVSYLLYVAYGFYKSKANIDINTGKQVKSNILLFRDGFFFCGCIPHFFNWRKLYDSLYCDAYKLCCFRFFNTCNLF